MKYIFLDTETSELPKTKWIGEKKVILYPYVIQIAWCVFDTELNKVISTYSSLIRIPDDARISIASTEIHKINKTKVINDGQNPLFVFERLNTVLKDVDKVVCHNIDFDIPIIKSNLQDYGMDNGLEKFTKDDFICTMKETKYKAFCNIWKLNFRGQKYLKYPTLLELHDKLFLQNRDSNNDIVNTQEIDKNALHDALTDVKVLLRCFIYFNYSIDTVRIHPEIYSSIYPSITPSIAPSITLNASTTTI